MYSTSDRGYNEETEFALPTRKTLQSIMMGIGGEYDHRTQNLYARGQKP